MLRRSIDPPSVNGWMQLGQCWMLISERTRTTNVLEFLEDPAISGLIRTPSKCCTNRLDRLAQNKRWTCTTHCCNKAQPPHGRYQKRLARKSDFRLKRPSKDWPVSIERLKPQCRFYGSNVDEHRNLDLGWPGVSRPDFLFVSPC